jgi:hypothetical protein
VTGKLTFVLNLSSILKLIHVPSFKPFFFYLLSKVDHPTGSITISDSDIADIVARRGKNIKHDDCYSFVLLFYNINFMKINNNIIEH